jgi:hypothetical protein
MSMDDSHPSGEMPERQFYLEAHHREALSGLLGMSAAEIDALEGEGVIARREIETECDR